MVEVYKFYGVKLELTENINVWRRFIKALFLSVLIEPESALEMIERQKQKNIIAGELMLDVIKSIEDNVDKEKASRNSKIPKTNFQKSLIKPIYYDYEVDPDKEYNEYINELKIYDKLESWIRIFNTPNREELLEYINTYALDKDKVFEICHKKDLRSTSPNTIKSNLDNYIIGQDDAKMNISLAFYIHLTKNRIIKYPLYFNEFYDMDERISSLPQTNMMILGPTGSGKSFIIKTLAEIYKIPFLKIDCASLVSSGYVGKNINDYLFSFYREHRYIDDKNNERSYMERSVIFFDEFDKMSNYPFNRDSVGGKELQQEFLNLIEDNIINIQPSRNSSDYTSNITVKSDKIMFIFSGCFDGIKEIIDKRINKNTLGFKTAQIIDTAANREQNVLNFILPEDIVKYGIIRELAGRISYYVPLVQLSKSHIIDIIKHSAKSPLKQYLAFFNLHLDRLIIEEDVFDLIADKVLELEIGARAIPSVLHRLLKDLLYYSPNKESETFHIDKEYFYKVFPN